MPTTSGLLTAYIASRNVAEVSGAAFIASRSTVGATIAATLAGYDGSIGYVSTDSLVLAYSEPESPDGLHGWYTREPALFIETPQATGAPQGFFYSLGTSGDPGFYSASASGSTTADTPVQVYETVLSGYANYQDIFLYYGQSAASSAQVRFPLAYTADEPSLDSFEVLNYLDESVSSGYVSTRGAFKFTKVRGFTSGKTSDEYKHRLNTINCYADGVLWATLYFTITTSGLQKDTNLNDTVCYYHNRVPSYSTIGNTSNFLTDYTAEQSALLSEVGAFVDLTRGSLGVIREDFFVEYNSDDPAYPGDDEYGFYDITVKFDSRDFPDNSTNYYGTAQCETGLEYRTTAVQLRRVDDNPVIDRIGVHSGESSEAVILGNVLHIAEVSGVEHTSDRRVPLIELPFNYDSLLSQDGTPPRYSSGTSFDSSGPFLMTGDGDKCLSIGGTSVLCYDNSCISLNRGTVEFWFSPASGSWNTHRSYTLFDFGKADVPSMSYDRVTAYFEPNDSNYWRLTAAIYDSFGTKHSVYFDTLHEYGAWPSASRDWSHIRFCWDVNDASSSVMKLFIDGSSSATSVTTGSTVVFGLLPSYDFTSISESGVPTMSELYTPFYIGGCTSGTGNNSIGYMSDFRILDVVSTDSQHTRSYPGGWTTSGVSYGTYSDMFKITQPALASNELRVVRIRAFDTVGNKPSSYFFNTASCRPVLLRGSYTGVSSRGETVDRFRIIDSQGEYEDLVFDVNPSSFSYNDASERINIASSISGKKLLSVARKQAEDREFSWADLTREYMLKIKERADSGNSFFLIDHNDNCYYGKLKFDSYSEKVATVPSRYEVSCTFIGQGGFYDYKMD